MPPIGYHTLKLRPSRWVLHANVRRAGFGVVLLAICVALIAAASPSPVGAQTAPALGEAESFAVLAGSTVTNTGTPTIVYGNLGVSPGTAVTGFPPGTVNGVIHLNTAVAQNAQGGVTAAFGSLDQPCTETLTGQDLGNRTLTPGVYCFDTSAGLTGTLTLDAQGNPNAVFIFKMGSTLTTASASSVNLVGNANACNVFWRVGSSATLGTSTNFAGNILAQESITLNSTATVIGRALARTGAVTMDNNLVDARSCGAPAATPTATSTTTTGATATATTPAGSTSTPVGSPTASGSTGTPPAGSTSTPTGTTTPPAGATSTPTGISTPPGGTTSTPTGTPTAPATGTGTPATGTGTPAPTIIPPGPPATGSGLGTGGASAAWLALGAMLLLVSAGTATALTVRRR